MNGRPLNQDHGVLHLLRFKHTSNLKYNSYMQSMDKLIGNMDGICIATEFNLFLYYAISIKPKIEYCYHITRSSYDWVQNFCADRRVMKISWRFVALSLSLSLYLALFNCRNKALVPLVQTSTYRTREITYTESTHIYYHPFLLSKFHHKNGCIIKLLSGCFSDRHNLHIFSYKVNR